MTVPMSMLETGIVALSLSAILVLSLYRFLRYRQLLKFLFEVTGVLLVFYVIHRLFGFPAAEQTSKGPWSWQKLAPVGGLYLAMIAGMLSQFLHARLSHASRNRARFDW